MKRMQQQMKQLKEKQRRLQYEIDVTQHALDRVGLMGELRDQLLQNLARLIERFERRVPAED